MKFELPNAVAAMNNAVAAVGEDGDSWEIVGDPLSGPVDGVVPDYDEKLDLKLDPSAGDKRAEICTVRWGKIEKDIARLNGLVAAIRNVSSVVKSGKDTLAHDWKGESFDAFRVSIEKVERTLDDYATAIETTANGMKTAVDGIRQLFTTYRDDTLEQHLVFDKFSKPADWKRMTPADAEFFAEHCTSHGGVLDSPLCFYSEMVQGIDRKLTNKRLRDQVEKWDCTGNPEVVASQYRYLVDSAYDERTQILGKIREWYRATDELKNTVGKAFSAALENLRIVAEVKVFSSFAVPGATAPGGTEGDDPGPDASGGDPTPGGSYPVDGGEPVGGGEVEMPSPEPAPEPTPEPDPAAVDSSAADPIAPEPEVEASEGAETVQIKDGDRTISVSSPDGQGLVKLTVDAGSGIPKTYVLDFDAASQAQPGDPQGQPAAEEAVTQVPARSDGKAVIQDGELTITAERPLFSPDAISITVDDGTGSPKTYTVDLPEPPDAAEQPVDAAEVGTGAQPAPGQPTSPQSWAGDRGGSLSGDLSDERDGEAGLASAPDAAVPQPSDALGMAGAGLPMASTPQSGDGPGRAGSGWSVHGDLFDSGEPVYSMHGVLGADDLESRK